MTPHLSLQSVRTLHLAAQGLLTPARRKATKADVLASIRRMSALQIDTISVVARSPWLVLFSRLGAFEPDWLPELLAEGKLFEYWSHEACFLPIEDYGLYRHRMIDPGSMGWKYSHSFREQHADVVARVLDHIRVHGPAKSSHFERADDRKSNGWWDWKPEKRALEILYTAGDLMVRRRESFQRVYDLRERVLPDWDDARDLQDNPTVDAELVRLSLKALGAAKSEWIADYFRMKRLKPAPILHALVESGEAVKCWCPELHAHVYVHADVAPLIAEAESGAVQSTVTALLSPFDPVVWDRKRALELFGFDYRIECYTPAPKRQYGYFVLPILHRGKLIGRLDAKAHRKEGIFEVKAFYLEDGMKMGKGMQADIEKALQRMADWHGTPVLRWTSAFLRSFS
ncbi:winged helix DNA-binding domain-containing protein [Burkholderiaceae bacterium DAT-1]|nr:winged helix DNA-binding domain-containing protein [Burkholderiaceae bacterium DAT-1]